MSYQDELHIDKYNLDNECATQPSLFMKYAEEFAEKKKQRQLRETELKRIEAEADANVRKNPSEYGLEDNPKEKAIAYAVANDPKVIEAANAFIEARKQSSIADAAKNAFEQRKIMLRVLGDLWLGEYYSATEVKKADVSKFRKKMGKRGKKKD